MTLTDEQVHIDNELRRVQIQRHPNFPAWFGDLPAYARQMLELVLDNDITPDMIVLADDAPDDQWHSYEFLRVIGGGNPSPSVQIDLTNITLLDIIDSLDRIETAS